MDHSFHGDVKSNDVARLLFDESCEKYCTHMYGCIEHYYMYEHISIRALTLVHACPIMHELLEDFVLSGKEKQEAEREM